MRFLLDMMTIFLFEAYCNEEERGGEMQQRLLTRLGILHVPYRFRTRSYCNYLCNLIQKAKNNSEKDNAMNTKTRLLRRNTRPT